MLNTPALTQRNFIELPKLTPGQTVSIISPSADAAGRFPHVFELGLARLHSHFGLIAKEYPSTRKLKASLGERAEAIMAAFEDPQTHAVFAAIGGSDQIRLIPLLDIERMRKNAKPFFGYSDNTHLCNFLWQNGIPSFYGASILVQLGCCGELYEYTQRYLHHALFDKGFFEVSASPFYVEEELAWDEPANLQKDRIKHAADPWLWDGQGKHEGILWGGCLESLSYQLLVNKHLPSQEMLRNVVLCLETCEDISPASFVERVMVGLGERGILGGISALLVGRPKAYSCFGPKPNLEERAHYRQKQAETMLRVLREYNTSAPLIFGLDFGHTEPQIPVPFGKRCRIDCGQKSIAMEF